MEPEVPSLLEEELAFFEKHRRCFIEKFGGRHLLIKGKKLIGAFTTREEAYDRGVSEFGQNPFLIKRAVEIEPVGMQPALSQGLLRADL